MAKFNKTNTIKTTNLNGHVAYSMEAKEKLVTACLTSFVGERKFYGDNTDSIKNMATECAKTSPEFVMKLAAYCRNEANLRSISHLLTAILARHGGNTSKDGNKYTRTTINNVVVRPDDITEIMSCYKGMFGKPFPNAMKRGMADAIQQFDAYKLAKYKSGNKDIKLKDVLKICHPKAKNTETEKLFKQLLDDTLETPYTWESELSARGNTAEVWNELIESGSVGYMALLRNLSNMIEVGADIEPVLDRISDPAEVKKSRQLPFRFYQAYATLEDAGLMNISVHSALEKAILASMDNLEKIPGRTLVAIDASGSMRNTLSARSNVTYSSVANLIGIMASFMCEDSTVIYFNTKTSIYSFGGCAGKFKDGILIQKYNKSDSILASVSEVEPFGGTDMSLPMKWALNDDTSLVKFDRVIYLSDNECNCQERTVQSYIDKYNRKFGTDIWVHGIDLAGYGTQQFCGKKFNLIAGWNESLLKFIMTAENGMNNLVKYIEDYPIK